MSSEAAPGRPGRKVRRSPGEEAPDWPDVPVETIQVEVARQIAVRLREAMGPRSARDVARICGLNNATVSGILKGAVWPDASTIASLESGLAADLWPAGLARSMQNEP